MRSGSETLEARLLEYAWSAWASLGVSGWKRGSFLACVDVDALLLLSARLGDADTRLRDEALDWCAGELAYVSRTRLARLLEDGASAGQWAEWAATLARATKQTWPGAGEPLAWKPTGKSRAPRVGDAAALALRCRALMGTTVRAELLRVLLLEESDRPFEARDLALEAAYSKRAVAEALEGLERSGVVSCTRVGNTQRFELVRRAELERLLGPMPRVRCSQRAFCTIAAHVLDAARSTSRASAVVRRVEAARLERELAVELARIEPPSRRKSGRLVELDDWTRWCGERAAEFAGGAK